jgi:hypothetical protein
MRCFRHAGFFGTQGWTLAPGAGVFPKGKCLFSKNGTRCWNTLCRGSDDLEKQLEKLGQPPPLFFIAATSRPSSRSCPRNKEDEWFYPSSSAIGERQASTGNGGRIIFWPICRALPQEPLYKMPEHLVCIPTVRGRAWSATPLQPGGA